MSEYPMKHCNQKCKVLTVCGLSVVLAAAAAIYFLVKIEDAEAKPPLGKSWPANQRVGIDRIDHSQFDALLKKYVDGDGYVDYSAWRRSTKDRRQLRNYLEELGRADLRRRASKSGKLAFWINAYNAVTLEGILQVYPTDSIRNHTSRFAGYNIWKHLPLTIGDQNFSLDDIEHKILRKMSEPRIHFAIVCASIGCPRLRNEAYTAEKLERQLRNNAVDFFSRSKNFRVNRRTRTVVMSDILKWFRDDFGNSNAAMLKAVSPYLPKSSRELVAAGGVRVTFDGQYNWKLNDQRSKPKTDIAINR